MQKRWFSLQMCVLLCLFACYPSISVNGQPVETIDIHLDLDAPAGQKSGKASGILFSMTDTEPPDSLLLPLKINNVRISYAQYPGAWNRIQRMGATATYVLSDTYLVGELKSKGEDKTTWHWPGEAGEWSAWEAMVTDIVRSATESGDTMRWEIWNEPDVTVFWRPPLSDHFEMWKRTYRLIRSIDPGAIIVGPSLKMFDFQKLKRFLHQAYEEDVFPDVITWHEIRDSHLAHKLPNRVQKMHAWLVEKSFPARPVEINEYLPMDQSTSPGGAVRYLAALEASSAAGATLACWPEQDPEKPGKKKSTCRNESLNGLLTGTRPHQPRSKWWVFRQYALLSAPVLQADVDQERGVSFILVRDDSSQVFRLLIGVHPEYEGPIQLRLNWNTQPSPSFHPVNGMIIEDSGYQPLLKPEVLELELERMDDTGGIILPQLSPGEACYVEWRVEE